MLLRHESPKHAVIEDDDKGHPWVATVNTEKYPGLAEAVLAAIEEHVRKGAKRNDETKT